ncbi:MAG: helix-turn-helix domain-containing protein [Pseudonocardiaceae bacterium]
MTVIASQQVDEEHTVGYYLLTEESMGASSTMRRRQLGMELRCLREAAGKTQKEAAECLGIPSTSISKIEKGKQRVSKAYLKLLIPFYDVGSPHGEALEQLRAEADQRGWWVSYGKTVPSWFADYVGMETAAAEIWTYESMFIPGVLQIPQYTEVISLALNPARTRQEIDRIVQLRADRQKRLTDDEPVILRAVISEAALRYDVGGAEVMRTQAERLVEAAHLPNVTVHVLPFSAGPHSGMRGAFTALRFPQEPMNTVYLELDGAALYLESPSEINQYASTFERLVDLALDPDSTVDLLTRIYM